LPPAEPRWSAVVAGDKFIRLSWNPNDEPDFKNYILYRNTQDQSASAQPLTTTSALAYQDDAVDYRQRYYYWLVAVDKGGHASKFSSSVNAVPVDAPPAQPKWSSIASGDKYLQLSWQANTERDLKQYRVYRSTTNDQATAQLIATQAATTYLDVQVDYGKTYYYWLVAVDAGDGASLYSAVKSGMPRNNPPATPTNVSLVRVNDVNTITWKSNTESDFSFYYVFRNTINSTSGATIVETPTTNTYTEPATPNVTSYYWIMAVDNSYNGSGYSRSVNDAVVMKDQQISFLPIPPKHLAEGSFVLEATATSGLPVSYSVSNTAVATINDNVVTLLTSGTVDITATQGGNNEYNAAPEVVQKLIIKQPQTITFNALPAGLAIGTSIALDATASSGLPVSYAVANPAVATIAGNTMTIVGGGTTDVTATQPGNDEYEAAEAVVQKLVVKQLQTITFDEFQKVDVGTVVALNAVASSGLPVTYKTNNSAVAQISNNKITAVGAGVAEITAMQAGDDFYAAAEPVTRTITVNVVTAAETPLNGSGPSLYPNPATDEISITLDTFLPGTPILVNVIDSKGTVVHKFLATTNGQLTLDVDHFVDGLYYVQLKQGDLHAERKFVKQ